MTGPQRNPRRKRCPTCKIFMVEERRGCFFAYGHISFVIEKCEKCGYEWGGTAKKKKKEKE